MKIYTNSLVETIQKTGEVAIEKANNLINIMKKAATQLKVDATGIYTAAITLRDVITRERRNISNGINAYSSVIRSAAILIKNQAVAVATQMSQAVSEIQVPLNYAKNRLDLLYRDRWNVAAVAVNAYYAVAHLTFYNAGGQQGALEEVMEAFRQIGGSFSGLGNSFVAFGNHIYNGGANLRNVINRSMATIGEAIRTFATSFQVLGNNLANVLDTAA